MRHNQKAFFPPKNVKQHQKSSLKQANVEYQFLKSNLISDEKIFQRPVKSSDQTLQDNFPQSLIICVWGLNISFHLICFSFHKSFNLKLNASLCCLETPVPIMQLCYALNYVTTPPAEWTLRCVLSQWLHCCYDIFYFQPSVAQPHIWKHYFAKLNRDVVKQTYTCLRNISETNKNVKSA